MGSSAMRIAWAVFVLSVVAWFVGYEAESRAAVIGLKGVPVLVLIGIVAGYAPRGPRTAAVLVGLAFSAVGDVVMELGHFVPGLLLFLCAHLAYITAWVLYERAPRLLRALPFAAWGLGMLAFLGRSALGDMAVPVSVYVAVICAMMWRAAARLEGAPRLDAAWIAMAGTLVFGLSDSLIALDKFHAPIPASAYAILLTYWAGQAAIAASTTR